MIGPLDYADAIEVIAEQYGERALALLRKIGDELKAEGFTIRAEPYDMSADDYRWSMVVQRPGTEDDDNAVDLAIEIAEAAEYDGDAARGGINFGLSIVEMGGRILGGLTPYNYTEHCWVPMGDAAEVEQRWSILEDADIGEIPALASGS